MTALIVIGIIVLIFAIILNIRIRAEVKFYGGVVDLKVKYFLFTVFPFKKKEKKTKKAKNTKSKRPSVTEETAEKVPTAEEKDTASEEISADKTEEKVSAAEEPDTESEENSKPKKEKKSFSERFGSISDIIEKVKVIWECSAKGLKKLFLHIYIDGLVIDFRIAGEDAYKTALNYGRISAGVYNAIGIISTLFRTNIRSVDIVCDFDGKKSVFDCEAKISIKPATIFSAVIVILFGLLKNIRVLTKKSENVKDQPDSNEAVTV